MRKLFISLATSFSFIIFVSCSKDSVGDFESLNSVENSTLSVSPLESIEPYISPKMASTIAFLDTCMSVVPIEQLFPIVNASVKYIYSDEDVSLKSMRSNTTLESYTGRTSQKILYKDKAVSISDVQILNWSSVLGSGTLKAGTYYLTAIAVYYQLIDSEREISKSYFMGTKMGVDPDDDTSIGYKLQNIASSAYLFTSYVYALKTNTGENYLATFVPFGFSLITDAFDLKWYYLAESK